MQQLERENQSLEEEISERISTLSASRSSTPKGSTNKAETKSPAAVFGGQGDAFENHHKKMQEQAAMWLKKEFKIQGQIGKPGERDKLSFSVVPYAPNRSRHRKRI